MKSLFPKSAARAWTLTWCYVLTALCPNDHPRALWRSITPEYKWLGGHWPGTLKSTEMLMVVLAGAYPEVATFFGGVGQFVGMF